MTTLFISRNLSQDSELRAYCSEKNIQLIAESLIEFVGINVDEMAEASVVFFTSPRSVFYFLQQATIQPNQQIAVVGSTTAECLKQYGLQADFIGANATRPEEVANEFRQWLGKRTVLFPISNRSNKTMQNVLNESQYNECIVYETQLIPVQLPITPSVLIFSSPSNVEAFLLNNSLYSHQKIVSFGTTTQQFLHKQGFDSEVLQNTTEKAMISILKKMEL
jgi:uroporphyrinogen-III synthase